MHKIRVERNGNDNGSLEKTLTKDEVNRILQHRIRIGRGIFDTARFSGVRVIDVIIVLKEFGFIQDKRLQGMDSAEPFLYAELIDKEFGEHEYGVYTSSSGRLLEVSNQDIRVYVDNNYGKARKQSFEKYITSRKR